MIKLNQQSINIVLYIILIVVIIILSSVIAYKQNTIRENQYNITALQDTLSVEKDRYQRLVYSQNILLMEAKELKTYNQDLYKEIQKGTKKNLAEINKLQLIIANQSDSIKNLQGNLISEDSLKYTYEFYKTTDFLTYNQQLSVYSTVKPSLVQSDFLSYQVKADLILKKYIDNNQIRLQVISNNPYLVISSIEGSVVDISKYQKPQKRKNWTLSAGLQLGTGVIVPYTNQQQVQAGFYGGFGLTLGYNIISF